MRQLEHIIEGSVYHVLNYMIRDLVKFGFKLGFENELADLKHLVDYNPAYGEHEDSEGHWQVDVELLNLLEAEDVDMMRDSLILVYECREAFRLINDLDADELLGDVDAVDQAAGLYEILPGYGETASYAALISDVEDLHFHFTFLVYLCVLMFTRNTLHVWEDDPFAAFCDAEGEIEFGESDHKNVKLLYGLINDLNGQNEKWIDYENNLKENGKI